MTIEIRNCEDALRVLAEHLDGELEPEAGAQLERHLAKCRSCYSRAEFEKRLKAQVAQLADEPVEPKLAGRVQSMIRKFKVSTK